MKKANLGKSAGWREIGSQRKYFRSKWEANYARYLEYLKQKGVVLAWLHEPDTFWFEGIKRGVNNYKPDFKITYLNGQEEYHEVKGFMDSKSKTKIKRMKKYFPEIKLIVVDQEWFKNAKILKSLISDWE